MSAISGAGLGLRIPHLHDILNNHIAGAEDIPWFEILADNFLAEGGYLRDALLAICSRYPTVLHGVGLSLGSTSPLDTNYLTRIKQLIQDTQAHWYSEHLSFSHQDDTAVPDLLPMPYTEEAATHMKNRIIQAQDILGQRILIENVSSYVSYSHSTMTEGAFLSAVANEADCFILLDINNAYINSVNFATNIDDFFNEIPQNRVKQIHLAGHQNKEDYLLDTHDRAVCDAVWQNFERCITAWGRIPSMIEWDKSLPPLSTLMQERDKAENILQSLTNAPTSPCRTC